MQRKLDCGLSQEDKDIVCEEEANVVADIIVELWHKRLCHMSEKGMRRLADDNLIPEVKNMQLEKCTDCLAGK